MSYILGCEKENDDKGAKDDKRAVNDETSRQEQMLKFEDGVCRVFFRAIEGNNY